MSTRSYLGLLYKNSAFKKKFKILPTLEVQNIKRTQKTFFVLFSIQSETFLRKNADPVPLSWINLVYLLFFCI